MLALSVVASQPKGLGHPEPARWACPPGVCLGLKSRKLGQRFCPHRLRDTELSAVIMSLDPSRGNGCFWPKPAVSRH